MNTSIQETAILIKHYEVMEQEIAKEGPEQLASISIVQKRYNQPTIEKLQRLIELEKLVPELIAENQRLGGIAHAAILQKTSSAS